MSRGYPETKKSNLPLFATQKNPDDPRGGMFQDPSALATLKNFLNFRRTAPCHHHEKHRIRLFFDAGFITLPLSHSLIFFSTLIIITYRWPATQLKHRIFWSINFVAHPPLLTKRSISLPKPDDAIIYKSCCKDFIS
jgi:hypothetical protein